MDKTIKLDLEISLADFFNSDNDRQQIISDIIRDSIRYYLQNHSHFYETMAHFCRKNMINELLSGHESRIAEKYAELLDGFEVGKWDVLCNPTVTKSVQAAIDERADDIKKKASTFVDLVMNDESTGYDSLYNKVSDAMANRVFDTFIEAMVNKEMKK